MDFYKISTKRARDGSVEIYPDFTVTRSSDLMVRGRSFYAVWDDAKKLWSTDEYDVQRLVDEDLDRAAGLYLDRHPDATVQPRYMRDFASGSWIQFKKFLLNLTDNFKQLDSHLVFADTEVKKKDYVSRQLPYSLEDGEPEAWNELISTLYKPEERAKLEWAIGAIIAGDAKNIQKFIVIYGEAGGGKSTVLNIIQRLFHGYYTTFEAQALVGTNNSFATEVFKNNPLVAIQHDGDLSQIKDNTKLNSIVSHEEMTMNEKYKSSYTARSNAFLFIGTNTPVKISNSKSGLIRRLININTSGKLVSPKRYNILMSQIDFELGKIAKRCLNEYRSMGKLYYESYRPLEMILETDFFYNFMEEHYFLFRDTPQITLSRGYELYKIYCEETGYGYPLAKHKFRVEFASYFDTFKAVDRINGQQLRSVYSDFRKTKFASVAERNTEPYTLVLDSEESLLDVELAECQAQYATANGVPQEKWDEVQTKLKDLDTKRLHFVRVPDNHIVVDFDLKDEHGNKSIERNIAAASKWPHTYAEYSKSQAGIHLHYIYDGDPEALSRVFAEGIEIKVSVGKASLRRQLSRCNTTPIATISSGLPLKEKRMLDFDTVKSEHGLRALVERNLRKEIHPGTKPSIDFIHKILEDAYEQGLRYDLTDMRSKVLTFAMNSTNQSEYCTRLVNKMKFESKETLDQVEEEGWFEVADGKMAFFDVEVFPNLFLVCWKYPETDAESVVTMINPKPEEIEALMRLNLVGFNNRLYDNHLLYGRYLGYNNQQLFELSSKIVNNVPGSTFREAYNVSYADIYEFSSKKQSLKAFEIELGINHQELGLPWDQPVPEEMMQQVIDYCVNDVVATEQVFLSRSDDFVARQILADLSGLPVNATTKAHTAKILFGNDRNAQDRFVYTDLSELFPGYTFDMGKSLYRGEDPGEGGYVYAEPGMYENVTLLDVASMHPTSIEELNLFGPYTKNYSQLIQARLAIKHGDFEKAATMFDGKLAKHLTNTDSADSLSYALKIVINIVYGLTSARFDNPFRDIRNIDNIVAKRGALFMIDLKYALWEKGCQVIHIKTDSVKIPNATPEIIEFVQEFGKQYGYTFEHEATYKRLCLVNNAVYVAQKEDNSWTATGAEFIHPYVFKTLFSKDKIEFKDLCETKQVTSPSVIMLDFNEDLPDVSILEAEWAKREKAKENPNLERRLDPELTAKYNDVELAYAIEKGHNYQFVGKISSFCPIIPGRGGGIMLRMKDDKSYAVTGTKGYRWMESEVVTRLNKEDDIDMNYFNTLVDNAITHLSEFGDTEWFLSSE